MLLNKIKKIPQLDKNKTIKKYIARFSSGNISLQFGNYITQKDVNMKRENILKHRFI